MRRQRRERIRYRIENVPVELGEAVIITPPASGRFPRPALLSFAATGAERVAEIRAEIVHVRREVRALVKKASARLRRAARAA